MKSTPVMAQKQPTSLPAETNNITEILSNIHDNSGRVESDM